MILAIKYFIYEIFLTLQQQQAQQQQKKKTAQTVTKRKVTRSSSLSSDASEESSSGSDTGQSSHGASESAETSDDSDSDPEVTINKRPSKIPTGKKTTSKEAAKRGKLASAKRNKKEVLGHSSANVSPSKSPSKTITKKPASGARPNTRQRGGSNMRRSRHVTGINQSVTMDTDSDMDMTTTPNESVASSPRKKSDREKRQKGPRNNSEKTKISSFSGDDSHGEEGSKTKNNLLNKDNGGVGLESSISASNIAVRLLASQNFERQNSSPSTEGFSTHNNRVSSNLYSVQSSVGHNNNTGQYHTGMTLPPVRRMFDGCTPMEERKCPTPGCDSMGHLSGVTKLDHHFTQEACPMYHNTIKKECRDFRLEINKKHSARRKANSLMAGARSPLSSPSIEQKRHSQIVSK